MNVFEIYTGRVRAIAAGLGLPIGEADLDRVTVELPRDASHGDLATNAAMVLAKPAGLKPRELADRFAEALGRDVDIETVDIAGPGFINMRLKSHVWPGVLAAVIADPAYGRPSALQRKVNVEYVSANPTGPMHVGHCRGAVFGDALASLLAFAGDAVTREYYINDAGGQIEVLARSAFLRYREALGEDIGAIPEGLYPGDYLVGVGEALKAGFGDKLLAMPDVEWMPIVRDIAIDAMMAMIRDDLAMLGVRHDVFFSERTLHAARPGSDMSEIDEMVDELTARKLVYVGRLPPPKGQLPDDWEDREQLLFRATDFGDDIDRPLRKSDGSYTYFAADVAYFRSKFLRGFKEMIYVLGADHGGYVKRLEAVGKAISGGSADVVVRLCQLVKLFRGGEPVRMSKRSGNMVTLREVVEEVGRDAVRFMMLFRKNDAPLDFDFVKVKEMSRDNPVFYVQYAHARTASVFRQAEEQAPGVDRTGKAANLSQLADEGEIGLMKRLAEYPRVIEQAARTHEPHRLAFYLYDLASDFHGHWNRGKDMPHLRFVNRGEPRLTEARLALVGGVAAVLRSGLAILGVSAPDEMR
jgi:arginyl-tRNA synthetase